MELAELLQKAKEGDRQALQDIVEYFEPFLKTISKTDGRIDESLHQDLIEVLCKFIDDYKL